MSETTTAQPGSSWTREPDRLAVSQETAARMLEVTSRTIRELEREGALEAVHLAGRVRLKRYRVSDLRRLAGEERK